MNKRTRTFLMVIVLLVITDSYAGVDDGLDKIMNPSEPVAKKPKVKPKPPRPKYTQPKSTDQTALPVKRPVTDVIPASINIAPPTDSIDILLERKN